MLEESLRKQFRKHYGKENPSMFPASIGYIPEKEKARLLCAMQLSLDYVFRKYSVNQPKMR
jgi:hypothetical protein